jgi:hypothetical protein
LIFLVLMVELKKAYITDKTEMRIEQVGYAINLILSRNDEPRSKASCMKQCYTGSVFP